MLDTKKIRTTIYEKGPVSGWAWSIGTKGKGNSGSVLAEGFHCESQAAAKAIAKATREAIEKRAKDFPDWLQNPDYGANASGEA